MSTIKTTNLQHPSAASPNLVLAADGSVSGGAGLGGLVVVSPTSIANSGGSASASGGEVTFTGVSSVSLNGVFTSSYENYRILLQITGSSVTDQLVNLRLRSTGSDVSTSTYGNAAFRMSGNNTTANIFFGTGTEGNLMLAHTATFPQTLSLDIFQPNLATATRITTTGNYTISTASATNIVIGSIFQDGSAVDGFSLLVSGNISGKIRVYGYKNS